jgi:hypothetical protein
MRKSASSLPEYVQPVRCKLRRIEMTHPTHPAANNMYANIKKEATNGSK